MKLKNRRQPADEFRKNKVTHHLAYVFEKVGHYYKNIGITHSKQTDGEDNAPLNKNPDPSDKKVAHVRPFPEVTSANRFGKKLLNWKFHKSDRGRINKIKKRRFRP